MSLVVKKIPKELSYNSLYNYFSKFGRINDFRIRNEFAKLQYDSFSSEKAALNAQHELDGYIFYVDVDREPQKCEHCPIHCGGQRLGDFGHVRERNYGKQGHPNDINKVVLENIPDCDPLELKDFVRGMNLDPVYSRITSSGKFGIVEFRTVEAKNIALQELDGAIFKDSKMNCRQYFNRERREHEGGYRNNNSGYEDNGHSRDERSGFTGESEVKTEHCEDLRNWNNNMTGNSAE